MNRHEKETDAMNVDNTEYDFFHQNPRIVYARSFAPVVSKTCSYDWFGKKWGIRHEIYKIDLERDL